jgi:hypothetical protein
MRIGALLVLLAAAGATALWWSRSPLTLDQKNPERREAPPVERVQPLPPTVQAMEGPYQPPARHDPEAAAAIWRETRVLGLDAAEVAKLKERQPLDAEQIARQAQRHQEDKEWKRLHPAGGSRR